MASSKYGHPEEMQGAAGQFRLEFSFLTNGASDPDITSPADGSQARGAIGMVSSIVHSATGKYTITFKNEWRWMITRSASIEDTASGDGAYATCGAAAHENDGAATTLVVFTCAATGTKTDYTSRRLSVTVVFKNSAAGV